VSGRFPAAHPPLVRAEAARRIYDSSAGIRDSLFRTTGM